MLSPRELIQAAIAALLFLWDTRMENPSDWADVAPSAATILGSAQMGVAQQAATAAEARSAEIDAYPVGTLVPSAFVGMTASGAPLAASLGTAATRVGTLVDAGMPMGLALSQGRSWTQMVATSVLQDTARDVISVDVAGTPHAKWIRQVTARCCPRCAILSGRIYRFSEGFKRHPNCGCVNVKFVGAAPETPTPEDLLSAGRIRGLSAADRLALDEGASISQVVNARRRAQGMSTPEGMTRRGWARKVADEYARQVGGETPTVRLTPSAILRLSSSRDEAVMLLARNGYFSDASPAAVAARGVRH